MPYPTRKKCDFSILCFSVNLLLVLKKNISPGAVVDTNSVCALSKYFIHTWILLLLSNYVCIPFLQRYSHIKICFWKA